MPARNRNTYVDSLASSGPPSPVCHSIVSRSRTADSAEKAVPIDLVLIGYWTALLRLTAQHTLDENNFALAPVRCSPALATAAAIAVSADTQAGTVTDMTGAQSVTLNTGDTPTINSNLRQVSISRRPTPDEHRRRCTSVCTHDHHQHSRPSRRRQTWPGRVCRPLWASRRSLSWRPCSPPGATYPIGHALTDMPLTAANACAWFGESKRDQGNRRNRSWWRAMPRVWRRLHPNEPGRHSRSEARPVLAPMGGLLAVFSSIRRRMYG